MSTIQDEIETQARRARARRRGAARGAARATRSSSTSTIPRASRSSSASASRNALPELLEEYGLTVSSPGPERPLSKPEHFRRFIGHRARVRTRDEHDGHKSFTGELVGASETEVTVAAGHRRRRDPVRRHLPVQPRRVLGAWSLMSREILEAMTALAREKGISPEKLMAALEDALLSAYKKLPGAARYARVEVDPETGDFVVIRYRIPKDLEARADRRDDRRGVLHRPGDRRPRRAAGSRDRPGEVRAVPGPHRGDRRHPRGLRPHRRADRQAGHPAADPRGRARHDVRGVPRPRRRADHRHRPAVGLPLHAGPAARSRRGAAAQGRAGRRRALRPRPARQGGHQGGLALHEGPLDHRLAPRRRADQEAVRARGAPRSPTGWWRSPTSPASPATAPRSRSSRTPTASTRSAPASARAAPACAWSSPSCAARRSTSSPTTTSPPGSSPRRFRRRASARCSSTTSPSRRRSSSPTTSSRWPSAARARTRGWPPA